MGILFKRSCPKCRKEVIYSRKDIMNRAEKENRLCVSCSLLGNHHSFGKSPPNKGFRKPEIQLFLTTKKYGKKMMYGFDFVPNVTIPQNVRPMIMHIEEYMIYAINAESLKT